MATMECFFCIICFFLLGHVWLLYFSPNLFCLRCPGQCFNFKWSPYHHCDCKCMIFLETAYSFGHLRTSVILLVGWSTLNLAIFSRPHFHNFHQIMHPPKFPFLNYLFGPRFRWKKWGPPGYQPTNQPLVFSSIFRCWTWKWITVSNIWVPFAAPWKSPRRWWPC